jgi:hypothetical protein
MSRPRYIPRMKSGLGVKLTTHLHLVSRSRIVELYLHSPIHLYCAVFNYFCTETTLPLPYMSGYSHTHHLLSFILSILTAPLSFMFIRFVFPSSLYFLFILLCMLYMFTPTLHTLPCLCGFCPANWVSSSTTVSNSAQQTGWVVAQQSAILPSKLDE